MKRAGTVLAAVVLLAACGKGNNHQTAEHQGAPQQNAGMQNAGAQGASQMAAALANPGNLAPVPPPQGMVVLRQAGTGRVFGVRFPGPPSATQLMQYFIGGLAGYFDAPPQFDHPQHDQDRATQVAFTGTVRGVHVRGLMSMRTIQGGGEGHLLIDYAERLPASFRYLMNPAASQNAAAGAGAYAGGNSGQGGNGGAYNNGGAYDNGGGQGGQYRGGQYQGAQGGGYPGGNYSAGGAYGAPPSGGSGTDPSGYAPGGEEAQRVEQNGNDAFDEYIRGTTMLEHTEGDGSTTREEVDQNYGHDMANQMPNEYREVPTNELNPAPGGDGDGGGYGSGGGYQAPVDNGGGYGAPADAGGGYVAPAPVETPAPTPEPSGE